jgi:hypothetical protein
VRSNFSSHDEVRYCTEQAKKSIAQKDGFVSLNDVTCKTLPANACCYLLAANPRGSSRHTCVCMYVSVVCETVIDVTPFLPCRRPRQAVVGAEADVEPPLAAAPLLDLGHREAVVAGVHLLDWLVVVAAGHGYVVCGSIKEKQIRYTKNFEGHRKT